MGGINGYPSEMEQSDRPASLPRLPEPEGLLRGSPGAAGNRARNCLHVRSTPN